MNIVTKSVDIDGKILSLETGKFAIQANGAVLGRIGDTLVLATVVAGSERPDLGYFPLTVEYIERLYAGGRIKGSRFVKREGRASDDAILTARLVDRSIRPLFPKNFSNEVQVIITVLSVDGENDPDVIAIAATSAALAISDIPWNGPVGAVRIGTEADNFIVNPTTTQMGKSDLDLVITAKDNAIVMVEAGAKEVPEEEMLKAFTFAQKEAPKIISVISGMVKEIGKKKMDITNKEIDAGIKKEVEKFAKAKIEELINLASQKKAGENDIDELKKAVAEEFAEKEIHKNDLFEIVDKLFKELTRKMITDKGTRPDGRKPTEIRPINIEIGLLPRTHGSAFFQRGETHALTIVTLGAPSMEQLIEGMSGEETKRYIHHYNFPPFSVGETGRLGWPSRREIGHGALAERALEPVIPTDEKFPYTIRIVSEIMSSNGSTSMASVCGSTLSLMDAGVPITSPVAGIAMGLITDTKGGYIILSDIVGFEDFFGDMDFKVAGTKKGITALQLDVKIPGLTIDIFEKAFAQAKEGRDHILGKMLEVMPEPRKQISQYAPKIAIIHVPTDKIGEVIGPGGKVIRQIIAQTGCTVDIEDDGSVTITGTDQTAMDKAIKWVENLTREVKVGEEFDGVVKRIQPFGAFVEILPGKDGLVHVSQMAPGYVSDPNTIVKLDQIVKVRVSEIDDMGRINLSMLFGEDANKPKEFRNIGNATHPSNGRPPPHRFPPRDRFKRGR